MPTVSMSTHLPIAAAKAWGLVGGFNALPDWHPGFEKSVLEKAGQQRRLSLAGGGTIVERLEHVDEHNRTYSYALVDSPFPVNSYKSTITVTDGKDKCTVHWSGEFTTDGPADGDITKMLTDIYQQGFDNLRKMFGG